MGLHTYICLDKVFGKRSAIGLGVLSRCRDFVGIVTMGAGDWCWPCGVCSGLVCVCVVVVVVCVRGEVLCVCVCWWYSLWTWKVCGAWWVTRVVCGVCCGGGDGGTDVW